MFSTKLSVSVQNGLRDQEQFRSILSKIEDSFIPFLTVSRLAIRGPPLLNGLEDAIEVELAYSPLVTSRALELSNIWRSCREEVYPDPQRRTLWNPIRQDMFLSNVHSCIFQFEEVLQCLEATCRVENLDPETHGEVGTVIE